MRIGFDAKRAFHNFSGLGNYSRNVINQLAVFYPDHSYYLYNPQKTTKVKDFPPKNAIVRFPENHFYRFFPFVWRSFGLTGVINNDRLDIFHGLSNELPFGITKFSGRKVVTIHDLIYLRFPDFYKLVDRMVYTRKFEYSVKHADAIIAISEQTKRDIIHFSSIDPSRIEVIYQDCAPAFYKQELSKETLEEIRKKYFLPEEYILYVGTIEKRKNLLSLFKALKQVNISLPVVVAGKATDYKKEVVNYIAENRIENVYFLQNLPQEDIPGIYRNSLLFVYPSSFEGFGIPILEALNSGIPVITSKGSCLEETGGRAGKYIDPFNTEEFGDVILKVLNDTGLRREMTEEVRKHAMMFRPEVTIMQLFNLYKTLYD